MFDFLEPEKLKILLSYPFVDDFLEGKLSIAVFNENLNQFKPELIQLGLKPKDIDLIGRVARNYSSGLVYNKKENPKLAAKRHFVLANEFKKAFPHNEGEANYWNKIIGLSRMEFVALYRKVYARVSVLNEGEINELIMDMGIKGRKRLPERLERLQKANWDVVTIDTRNVGVWPGFWGDIPLTLSHLAYTADKAKQSMERIPGPLRAKIESMKEYSDLIYKFFPIIVTRKGPKTRRVVVNEFLKKVDPEIQFEITEYDIADGNHRALLYALMGVRKIQCFVGSGLKEDTLPLNIQSAYNKL